MQIPFDTKLKIDGIYPVVGPLVSIGCPAANRIAKWTGEKRCPKKGEWYLSGAIIEAYRALNDLGSAYHIAKVYEVTVRPVRPVIEIVGEIT